MTSPTYVLGVDIGTTSTKAVLFTETGDIVAKAAVGYPLNRPTPEAAEQDPVEICAAVKASVGDVMAQSDLAPSQVRCLSFSAAMHSLILVDAANEPLTASITWADNRSADWVSKIRQNHHGHDLYRRTGTPIHPMSPLVKLVWLRHDHADLFQRAERFISIKEYVLFQLCQEYVVDYSIAGATGLFNIKTLDWDADALELAGVSPQKLSRLVPTTHVMPPLQPACAAEMGLARETPVVVGASDGCLANLGVGAIAPGTVAITLGTSGAIRTVAPQPQTDPSEILFCYPLTDQHWVIGGAVNNGGIVFQWVRDRLAATEVATAELLQQDAYELLTDMAATIPPGADGILFHPYLAGERSPLWNADARGSFFGLALHHTKAHLVRAVLEGVVFNLRLVLEALEEAAGKAETIRASGGFAQSELWRQILADICDRPITVPESYEASCFGAALLGLCALGDIPSLEEAAKRVQASHEQTPVAENVACYQPLIPIYGRLLDCFKREYGPLARLSPHLKDNL